jgi:hypothetical protein
MAGVRDAGELMCRAIKMPTSTLESQSLSPNVLSV